MKQYFNIWCLAVFLAISPAAIAQVTNISHPDNLRATHDLPCIGFEQIRPQYTPADLAHVVVKCAKKKVYNLAMEAFFVYSMYGSFDGQKMKDRSASAAIPFLNQVIFTNLTKRQQNGFSKAAKQFQNKKGSSFLAACNAVKRLGPPQYVPIYMAAHGLKAFVFKGDNVGFKSRKQLARSLKKINSRKTWEMILFEVNKCPK